MVSRCAACQYLRRRCPLDCIFSHYFPPNDPERFASVHRIFGASNVAKMLQQLPENMRAQAADSLYYEAKCRIEDPIYGCAGIISSLLQEIHSIESEIARTNAQIAMFRSQVQESNIQQTQSENNFSLGHNSLDPNCNSLGGSSRTQRFI